ncbi:hypothetical protein BaRGS_00038346, partial [Batillaria attramentaria]
AIWQIIPEKSFPVPERRKSTAEETQIFTYVPPKPDLELLEVLTQKHTRHTLTFACLLLRSRITYANTNAPSGGSHVIATEWWTVVWVWGIIRWYRLCLGPFIARIMPLFGKKHDSDKKHSKDGDVRKRYEFKDTLGT